MIEIVILKPGHDVIIVRVKEEHMKNKKSNQKYN